LVYDDTAPMLEGHPALAQLHVVGRKWRSEGISRIGAESRLFAALRKRRYGLVVHLSEQPRGAWLARTLGARYSVAPRMPDRGAFWTNSFTHLYPIAARRHQVEVNLDALRRIGLQPDLAVRKVQFGPSGESEWGPWNVIHRVIRSTHSCRPCGLDGCGGGKVSECLTFLSVEAVHAAVRELLPK